jgi:uncharacterized protein YlaN (UPF0358 family)
MAQPRTWLPRADEIAEVLRKMKSRDLDRAAIEELFQLQRRAAIVLMQQAGATGERGAAWTIERTSLLSWVERISRDEAWQIERRRAASVELSKSMREVQAVRAALAQAERPVVRFPLVEEVLNANCASLPREIEFASNRIVIHLSGEEPAIAACQLLYQLGMALANDFEGFASLLTPGQVS